MPTILEAGIVALLNAKGIGTKPCPSCGCIDFDLISTESNLPSNPDASLVIPVCIVGCNHCGHLSFHALGPLKNPPLKNPPPEKTSSVVDPE